MKIYEVHNGGEFGSEYFLTKAEALREHRELVTGDALEDPEHYAVDLLETVKPDKHGILAILRDKGWVTARVRVWPKKRTAIRA